MIFLRLLFFLIWFSSRWHRATNIAEREKKNERKKTLLPFETFSKNRKEKEKK